MKMISVMSKEFIAIGYNSEEKSIYVKDKHNVIRIFENKSKEDFDHFMNSKQQDYHYQLALNNLSQQVTV